MKTSFRLLLIALILSICSIAFAKSGYVYTAEFANIDCQASRSIFVCSDNSVVVLGNADDTFEFHFYYLSITKLNPQGELMWRQWMGGGGTLVSITGVDIDANDTVTFITTSEYIRLWSIDRDGTLHFLSVGTDIPNQGITFNKALRMPNGDIVAVGKASQNYDVSSACFFRFTATGDTLASAFWPVDQESQYLEAEAYDLALMDNSNVLVACSLRSDLNSILELNRAGSIVNRYDLPGQDHFSAFPICRESDSHSYLVAYSMGEYPNNSIFIDRFENGTFEHLFSISPLVLIEVNSMILTPDCIYLCGIIWGSGSLLNLSFNGDVNWIWNQEGNNTCWYIDDGFGSYSTALLDLDDAGCVYWAWGNMGQQVIIKLLPNGQVPVEDEVQAPSVNRISAYPNPMTNLLTIKAINDDLSLHNDSIDIFNIKGQLVRSLKLSKSETIWDGRDAAGGACANGIYFLRLECDGLPLETKKISLIK